MGKEKPTTKICKHCKTEIPYGAKICPQCRKKQKGKGGLIAIAAVVVIGIIGATSGGGSNSKTVEVSATKAANESPKTTEPVTGEKDASIPTEYKSALKSAETYSDTMHMSKMGIYDQLTSEYGGKFTVEAAQYAIDNITADWNDNALKTAKTYSDTMHMSKQGVYEQLISDYGSKFTEEEAQYAVDNLAADWNANALESAKTYQNTMNMSPAAIRDQLISDFGGKFTEEEADFALANLE